MKKRPLEGIKILDFSQVLSAPFCGMMLADLGAQVIKVERPGRGDISREYGPYINDISLYFCQYNRGKKGLAIDMRSEEGKAVVMDLVPQVDIVIENFKAGTLEKLGIGYEEMLKVNPELIYGSRSGFGTHGPLSHLPCMDIIAAARSGLVGTTGVEGEAPIKPGFSLCDTWAGLHLLRGLSMALLHKQRTGKGVRVDIAMLDCAFYMCEAPVLNHSLTGEFGKRTGNHDPFIAPRGEFTAADGNVVIDVTNEEDWPGLCDALGLSDLTEDPRFTDNESRVKNRAALIAALETVTASMGRYEIEGKLRKVGVPASAVQSLAEFAGNPQTKELDVITKINQPGVGDYTAVSTPIRFSKTPVDPNAEAPSFPGSHTIEVLTNLGYSREKIDALIAGGAVHQPA
jgi:crotonobetainyl-CoA:carnitine CoA-transferase CaiB-like acyl-CoA transferase